MSRGGPRKSKSRRQVAHVTRTPKCPPPRKLAFSSEESAHQFLRYSHHEGRDRRPERAHLCGCGSWHTTSKPAYGGGADDTGPSRMPGSGKSSV
jgi:hypothetical protein